MPRRNRGPRLVFRKDRDNYYIRWYQRGRGRWISAGTADRRQAEDALASFIRRNDGTQRPRELAEILVLDVLEDYAEERAINTASPERIAYAIEALGGFWGALCCADVTEETCQAYKRFRNVADGTLRRELGVLRAAINHAVKRGRLTRPAHVWLPANPEPCDRWLTRAEVATLLWAARHSHHARLYLPLFVLIGVYTGARKEAILSLRWPQVDLHRGRIDFNPIGRRRTNKRRPIIPIPRKLLWFLRKARERGSETGHVVHRNGRPILDIKRSFGTAVRRSGLENVTPHTLRHTAGTWMAQAGVDLWQVSGFLGHSHARTTQLYAHHHPDFLLEARKALDR